MTKYREIISLTGLGFTQRNIMQSCDVAQKTIVKVQHRAKELNLSWPLDESITNEALEKLMLPKTIKETSNKRMPNFTHIRKELLRNGVSKKLLWTEYMEECRLNRKSHSCILNSAITSNRMNRNAALPCISIGSRVNRWKLIEPEIRHISLILIPAKSSMSTYSLVS